ncbi:MAG: heme o synthase [Pseudomonadota bacterium]
MTQLELTEQQASQPIATAADYVNLLKPRIMVLVVFTGLAALAPAIALSGVSVDPVLAAISILAIALGSGAAGAINMWYDADIDAKMARTATRPIPSGAVPRDEALTLGLMLGATSVLLMWMASNVLAAVLLAVSIAYYGWFYTVLLKRRTPQNIVIGGAAGAFPPVIAWASVTGTTPLDAWILFAIIFFWTPPHFWALSLLAKKDYAEANVPMLPVTHGAQSTRRHVFVYTLVLIPVAMAPVVTGLGGAIYAVIAAGANAVFLWQAFKLLRSQAGEDTAGASDRKIALSTFGFSIGYLFLLFGVILAEHTFGLHWPLMGGI